VAGAVGGITSLRPWSIDSQHGLRLAKPPQRGCHGGDEDGALELGELARAARQASDPVVGKTQPSEGGELPQSVRQGDELVVVKAQLFDHSEQAQAVRQARDLYAGQSQPSESGQLVQVPR
jgi:hypothetical protein